MKNVLYLSENQRKFLINELSVHCNNSHCNQRAKLIRIIVKLIESLDISSKMHFRERIALFLGVNNFKSYYNAAIIEKYIEKQSSIEIVQPLIIQQKIPAINISKINRKDKDLFVDNMLKQFTNNNINDKLQLQITLRMYKILRKKIYST